MIWIIGEYAERIDNAGVRVGASRVVCQGTVFVGGHGNGLTAAESWQQNLIQRPSLAPFAAATLLEWPLLTLPFTLPAPPPCLPCPCR